jgi:hypothetical protein
MWLQLLAAVFNSLFGIILQGIIGAIFGGTAA